MNMNFTKTVTKVNWVKLALTIVVIGVAGWLLTFLLLKGISMVKNKILEGKLVNRTNAKIKDGDVTLTPSELNKEAQCVITNILHRRSVKRYCFSIHKIA